MSARLGSTTTGGAGDLPGLGRPVRRSARELRRAALVQGRWDVSRPGTYTRPGQTSVKVAGLLLDQAIEQLYRRIVLFLPRLHERYP